MSLDIAKLEKVRELAGGIVQARCPACAQDGHDRSGEHLRVYPDGRFGCCVHPKDGVHRKLIWSLAGSKSQRRLADSVSLRLKTPPALPAARSVKAALTAFAGGTFGTGKGGLVSPDGNTAKRADTKTSESGTLGAAKVKLCARARVDSSTTIIDTITILEKLEDSEGAVLSVPSAGGAESALFAADHLPYLTAGGTLVIPHDSPERYHWWMPDGERMSVAETLVEVHAGLTNKKG